MQFTTFLVASAAFALASAKVAFTVTTFATVTAGEPFELTWSNATGPVTITLRGRQPGATVTDPNNLAVLQTIDSGLTGDSYTWNVPATLASETYALQITDGSTENYSTLFELIGGAEPSGTTSGSVTRTATGSTSSGTASETSSSTDSSETESATTSSTTSSRTSSVTTTRSTSSTPSSSPTSAPAGGMANGLTSNLALVFVAAGALFMVN